jgi:hypothetical protein
METRGSSRISSSTWDRHFELSQNKSRCHKPGRQSAKSLEVRFSETGFFEGGPGCELGLAVNGYLFSYTRRMLAPTAASFSSMRS